MKRVITVLLKEIFLQMVISLVLVAICAFIVLKISLAENVLTIMIYAIYALASFVGGVFLGKVMEKRRFLWGALAGTIYIGVILLISATGGRTESSTVSATLAAITSVLSGMVGGMIS